MAKAKEEVAEEVVEEKPKGRGKKKLLIILAAVVVLVLAAGTAVVLLLMQPVKGGAQHHVESAPPIYESLKTFTVNLSNGDSYLQVEIKLLVASTDFEQRLKERMPEIRDNIILLLSSKSPDELSTEQGKLKLADQIRSNINGLLRASSDKGVKKVLFGAFLIQ